MNSRTAPTPFGLLRPWTPQRVSERDVSLQSGRQAAVENPRCGLGGCELALAINPCRKLLEATDTGLACGGPVYRAGFGWGPAGLLPVSDLALGSGRIGLAETSALAVVRVELKLLLECGFLFKMDCGMYGERWFFWATLLS